MKPPRERSATHDAQVAGTMPVRVSVRTAFAAVTIGAFLQN
jgi:hypothetical protein